MSFCVFFCFPLSFLFGLRLSSGTSQLPLPLRVCVPPLCVCVCVSNACHVTKLYNFQTGRTSPIVTFPVNLAPAQPGLDPNPGTDRGMDLAVPHIFDTWPGKSQEKCATNNFSHLSLSLFTAALQNAITFPSGEGGGRWGAGRKVT